MEKFDALIIGGGFFGCRLALLLKQQFNMKVLLLEKGPDLMLRASYTNQARVHNGYHYPRSVITAMRSRINFPRFVDDFKEAVVNDFEKYYAVATPFGKVTAKQFEVFYDRVGAPMKVAPANIKAMFNTDLVEQVWTVREYAFNSVILRERTKEELNAAKVHFRLNNEVLRLQQTDEGLIAHNKDAITGEQYSIQAKFVFNCTYANINTVLQNSGFQKIHLKQELTEMCAVKVPDILKDKGFTVMCGPFFSLMPFPSLNLHSFSHVRYTPHRFWFDKDKEFDNDTYFNETEKHTNFLPMQKDSMRYMPILKDLEFVKSLWELKTVLPANESDDARPILFRKSDDVKNLINIMGGKIDNIYDMEDEVMDLQSLFQQ